MSDICSIYYTIYIDQVNSYVNKSHKYANCIDLHIVNQPAKKYYIIRRTNSRMDLKFVLKSYKLTITNHI